MWQAVIIIVVCFVLLTWSADIFVDAAVVIADYCHVPKVIIGTVLVGFATAFPELLVSFDAALHGAQGIAIGNALGSYIINIALVLGVTALIQPIHVSRGLLRQEIPVMGLALIIASSVLYDGYLSQGDGLLLLVMLALVVMGFVIYVMRHIAQIKKNIPVKVTIKYTPTRACVYLLFMLLVMLSSARFLTSAAVDLAHFLGVSDLMIGLTIVAVGTSLPELAASIAGVKKGEDDIAIGNVIGSNILGLLGVLAMPALFSPGDLSPMIWYRDCAFMAGLTLLFWVACVYFDKGVLRINRIEGLLGVALYGVYIWLLVLFPG